MKSLNIGKIAQGTGRSLISWSWTKKLLYWIILSAGTMSECVFLIASIWMSINANVHTFVLLFLSEADTIHITQMATTAYVALPECIVGLAMITTISHIRMWKYGAGPVIWSILFGLPTLVFMGLSLFTLGNSVAFITFNMPTQWVVIRALAGYMFAFVSLVYTQLGVPQERDRLDKKDGLFAALRQEKDAKITELAEESTRKLGELERITGTKIADLQKENQRLNALIAQQNQDLELQKKQHSDLVNALHESSRAALEAYSEECKNWLMSGIKTVSVEQITQFTGHSKRKLNSAITLGNLQVSPRNKHLILVSSLIEWLEQNPPSSRSEDRDTGPIPLYPNAVNG